jgi:hypothetical protein
MLTVRARLFFAEMTNADFAAARVRIENRGADSTVLRFR